MSDCRETQVILQSLYSTQWMASDLALDARRKIWRNTSLSLSSPSIGGIERKLRLNDAFSQTKIANGKWIHHFWMVFSRKTTDFSMAILVLRDGKNNWGNNPLGRYLHHTATFASLNMTARAMKKTCSMVMVPTEEDECTFGSFDYFDSWTTVDLHIALVTYEKCVAMFLVCRVWLIPLRHGWQNATKIVDNPKLQDKNVWHETRKRYSSTQLEQDLDTVSHYHPASFWKKSDMHIFQRLNGSSIPLSGTQATQAPSRTSKRTRRLLVKFTPKTGRWRMHQWCCLRLVWNEASPLDRPPTLTWMDDPWPLMPPDGNTAGWQYLRTAAFWFMVLQGLWVDVGISMPPFIEM